MQLSIPTNGVLPLAVATFMTFAATASPSVAQQRPTFIRDAEIETTIREFATPVFEAAGLDAGAVRVYIIKDDAINAFVAGGMNVFLYTGLLMQAASANQLIGVIAHETGHISGGHLARSQDALRAATIEQMIACVLGVGAAVASGEGAAVSACALGSSVAQRSLLQYSRTQEAAADQAGLSFLDATRQSARGTLEFLTFLARHELLMVGRQDPYLRSHPLTQERMDSVRQHIQNSPYSDVPDSPEFVVAFKRMRAKLFGYLEPLARVKQEYPDTDTSLEARYARAIANFLGGKQAEAAAMIDALIAEHPADPYFQELKGEMLFKSGRARDALPFYDAAAKTVPDSALLRVELARVQLEIGDPALNKPAIAELEEAVRLEPRYATAWRQLSIAYGRDGQLAMTALALAEAASANGKAKEAKQQADRAMQGLPVGSPAWLRAQDILNEANSGDD